MLPDRSPVAGMGVGIQIQSGANGNIIGYKESGIGNLIVNATTGIVVTGGTTVNNGLFGNTITVFSSMGIQLVSSGNYSYAYPEIHMADTAQGVSGTAQYNDYIEVFIAENNPSGYGGSVNFLGYTTADGSGNWSLPAGGFVAGQYICATAAEALNNTSEFSENFLAATPPGTYTITPTVTVTPTITPTATLTPTQSATATVTPTISATSTQSATVTVTPTISATSTQSATYTATGTITPTGTVTPTVTVTYTSTSTSSYTPANALARVDLKGNFVLPYPNPANTEMKFVLHLEAAAEITLVIYNFSGERIVSLEAALPAGQGQTMIWDCQSIAAGVYLLRVIKDGNLVETQKIAVVH